MALAVTSKTFSGALSSKNTLHNAGKNTLGGQLKEMEGIYGRNRMVNAQISLTHKASSVFC